MSSRKLTRPALIVAFVAATLGTAAAAPPDDGAPPDVETLQSAIRTDGWSVEALFGLGTAYQAAGEHGRAVLAFERAHLLAPRDEAVSAALQQARTAAGVTAPERSRAVEVFARLTTDEWTWIALAGAFLACAGIAGMAWRIRPGLARTMIVAGASTALVAGMVARVVAPPAERAIVTTTSTARISPFPTAQGVFEALEGESVQIEQERSEFFFVRDGERSGWVPRDSVELVIPESS